MFVVGLTGGIGSGKSTLARSLAERGAFVIDADELGRRALDPGQPAWNDVVETFGSDVLAEGSMEIDRPLLAEIVFADPDKLAALNAIVHPVILEKLADTLETLKDTGEIVVLDAALIVEMGLQDSCDVLVVVTAPEDSRSDRLRIQRDMSIQDIRARMASQRPTDEQVAAADIIVDNSGDLEQLYREADRVWEEIKKKAGSA